MANRGDTLLWVVLLQMGIKKGLNIMIETKTDNVAEGSLGAETDQGEVSTEDSSELTVLRKAPFAGLLDDIVELLSQSRTAFLLGAGCSKCAGLPLMEELTTSVLAALPEHGKTHNLLTALQGNFEGSTACNIEDLMSELVDWVSITQRRNFRSSNQRAVKIGDIDYTHDDLMETLLEIRAQIAKCISGTDVQIDDHKRFIESVQGRLQDGKANMGKTVEYFTLNYDTLIEDALGFERVPYADGFSGGTTGWWNSSEYGAADLRAKIYKMHGSIDWCCLDDDVFPRRLRGGSAENDNAKEVMIWPAATKYRETQRDPFAQILDMFKTTLRPSSSELVLCICGYGFGDDHINHELERALYESQERLTLLVFTGDDAPTGRLKEWLGAEEIKNQIRVYAKRGFFHGDEQVLSDQDLPWWKFEILARILGGQR